MYFWILYNVGSGQNATVQGWPTLCLSTVDIVYTNRNGSLWVGESFAISWGKATLNCEECIYKYVIMYMYIYMRNCTVECSLYYFNVVYFNSSCH